MPYSIRIFIALALIMSAPLSSAMPSPEATANVTPAKALPEPKPELGVYKHLFAPSQDDLKVAHRKLTARDIALGSWLMFSVGTAVSTLAQALNAGFDITLLPYVAVALTSAGGLGLYAHALRKQHDPNEDGPEITSSGRIARQLRQAHRGFLRQHELSKMQHDYQSLSYWARIGRPLSPEEHRLWNRKTYRHNYSLAHFAALIGDATTLEYMMKQGFDVSRYDASVHTPFDLASIMGHTELAPLFAKYNIKNLNKVGSEGVTSNLASLIIRLHAQQHLLTREIFQAPEHRVLSQQPKRLGVGHQAGDLLTVTPRGELKMLFSDIITLGSSTLQTHLQQKIKDMHSWVLAYADEQGVSALHIAAAAGNYQAVEWLAERGLSFEAITEDGLTARDILTTHIQGTAEFTTAYIVALGAAPSTQQAVWQNQVRELHRRVHWTTHKFKWPISCAATLSTAL